MNLNPCCCDTARFFLMDFWPPLLISVVSYVDEYKSNYKSFLLFFLFYFGIGILIQDFYTKKYLDLLKLTNIISLGSSTVWRFLFTWRFYWYPPKKEDCLQNRKNTSIIFQCPSLTGCFTFTGFSNSNHEYNK